MPITDRIAIGALAVALLAVGLGGWLIVSAGTPRAAPDELPDPFGSALISPVAVAPELLVVDVEGAVLRPGVIELPGGSRVADAIQAAGGYSAEADLAAAAGRVNLAGELQDGQQIVVPIIGSAGGGGSATGGSGLVDLNTASANELDALPGIGPATVEKIVAARTEQPFSSLEEMVTRKVLTSSQVDKIRDLVTLG
ncbi:MAG TPA: helix-hairpin-helix domain-containing protein [Methylomirabilota bacterium]|nr:helix-hairpin-helix domain-containing protein [Methylomirabilota bacterium]